MKTKRKKRKVDICIPAYEAIIGIAKKGIKANQDITIKLGSNGFLENEYFKPWDLCTNGEKVRASEMHAQRQRENLRKSIKKSLKKPEK